MNEQPPSAARKLCPESNLSMQQIAAWDRETYEKKWLVNGNRVLDTSDTVMSPASPT